MLADFVEDVESVAFGVQRAELGLRHPLGSNSVSPSARADRTSSSRVVFAYLDSTSFCRSFLVVLSSFTGRDLRPWQKEQLNVRNSSRRVVKRTGQAYLDHKHAGRQMKRVDEIEQRFAKGVDGLVLARDYEDARVGDLH